MTNQHLVDLVMTKFDGEIMIRNQWRVDGSKGKHYTVEWDPDHRKYNCNCLGYTYRRKCRHITELSSSFGLKKGIKNGK